MTTEAKLPGGVALAEVQGPQRLNAPGSGLITLRLQLDAPGRSPKLTGPRRHRGPSRGGRSAVRRGLVPRQLVQGLLVRRAQLALVGAHVGYDAHEVHCEVPNAVYTMELSARSSFSRLDRIVIHEEGVANNTGRDLMTALCPQRLSFQTCHRSRSGSRPPSA